MFLIEKLVHYSEQLLLIITTFLNLSFIVVSLGNLDYATVFVSCSLNLFLNISLFLSFLFSAYFHFLSAF